MQQSGFPAGPVRRDDHLERRRGAMRKPQLIRAAHPVPGRTLGPAQQIKNGARQSAAGKLKADMLIGADETAALVFQRRQVQTANDFRRRWRQRRRQCLGIVINRSGQDYLLS
ncbi:hypothetical protein SDC9_202163 [bioreactor metagenome]|uniref:Uncharacterized protein n=1 Tax=bioreactor metagenome TaxID=1076179 RepID=A0A645J4T9_9ZZZZ